MSAFDGQATPRVIAIGGFAGSGKTELARILTRETGWPILDKDTLTRPVVEAALEALGRSPDDRESEVYLEKIRPREYECLMAAMVENLQCGNSAILAAPFIKEFANPGWISRLEATCADLGATLHIVWVHCDPGTMHTYVRHRGAARDIVKLSNWADYLIGVDTHFRPPRAAHRHRQLLHRRTTAGPGQAAPQLTRRAPGSRTLTRPTRQRFLTRIARSAAA